MAPQTLFELLCTRALGAARVFGVAARVLQLRGEVEPVSIWPGA